MSLEDTVRSLSREMAHRDKRRREEVTPEHTPLWRWNRMDPCITDWCVQQRLTEAAERCFAEHFKVRSPASSFAAKTAVAAWRACQMMQPLTFCFDWVSLLIVCCIGVDAAFHDRAAQDVEDWSKSMLDALFEHVFRVLGMSAEEFKAQNTADTHKFMMASREWSRLDKEVKYDSIFNVYRALRNNEARDQLFRAVISPCVRAHLIVKN